LGSLGKISGACAPWPQHRTPTELLTAFSALTLSVGRQEGHPACKKTEWWGAGVVICLDWGADDLHICPADANATPSSVASVKWRMVLPLWCRLTVQVVVVKRP